jgi:hypothetical protein
VIAVLPSSLQASLLDCLTSVFLVAILLERPLSVSSLVGGFSFSRIVPMPLIAFAYPLVGWALIAGVDF